MMRERLIDLVNRTTTPRTKHKEFSEMTGLERRTVKALLDGAQRFNEDHIKAISAAFPQYKMWFVFGEIHPDIGQISPELDQTAGDYQGTGTDT